MSETVPKWGFLDSAGQIFQTESSTIMLQGRTPVSPWLAQLFWVKTPETYLVFTLKQNDADEAALIQRLLREGSPLVKLESESEGKGAIALFGGGNEADAAKAATLVKIVCGWEEAELFEMGCGPKKYQVNACLSEDRVWVAQVV
jgi:hypothetical protein